MNERFRAAGAFALKHLTVSALIATLCAALVFGLWYPYPYSELAGGRDLFALLITVDVVIGPLLSLAVYNPKKLRTVLWRDLATIFVLQLGALSYGLYTMTEARPVWLAFEADLFRVVAVPDIDATQLSQAPSDLSRLSWTGPRTIGVKLIDGSDPEFLQSIELSMQGVHPAFRPQRWVDYDLQRERVIRQSKPLSELKRKHPEQSPMIDDAVRKSGLTETDLGYVPLVSQHGTDWIVAISLKDGSPKLYLPLDGW